MSTSFAKGFRSALSLAIVLASAGCIPGLTSNMVSYDKERKWGPSGLLGPTGDPTEKVPCRGCVAVEQDHGIFYLIGPEGSWWQHETGYGIYFKEGPDVPGEFYLVISRDK